MNWSLGFRRLGIALSVLYLAGTAVIAGLYSYGENNPQRWPVGRYKVGPRCYDLKTPPGREQEGRRFVADFDKKVTYQRWGVFLPVEGATKPILVDVCRPIEKRVWLSEYLARWQAVTKPAAMFFVVLWLLWSGARWIAGGFTRRPQSD